MRSLAAHFADPAAHDRLPFHPSCPICRQTRLTGKLPADDLLSARTQAVLAAGVLAVSSTAPGAVAFAAEQDQQQDGTAAVTQTTTDPADSPDFDPGGDATDLPKTAPPVPQSQVPMDPGNDDTTPVDQTSATNPDDPIADSGDGSDSTPAAPATPAQPTTAPSTTATDTSTPAATSPTPVPHATDTTAPPSSTPAPAPEANVSPSAAPRGDRRASRSSRQAPHSHRRVKSSRRGPAHVSPPPVTPAPATRVAAPSAQVVAVATPVGGEYAKPGDRAHTVLPGESLWTIATDLLGQETSTAEVAREVHRLWQLNRDRIGTGNPDLLMVGTRLDLR